jgi:hypothetical protein
MTNNSRFMAFVVVFLGLSVPLFAHHGAASYDTAHPIMVTGTATEYIWANPHVIVKLDVKDDSGNITHWVLEAWNPVTQTSRGWTKNTFKAGDEVTAEVTPAKNSQPVGEFRGKIVINGKQFKP